MLTKVKITIRMASACAYKYSKLRKKTPKEIEDTAETANCENCLINGDSY